MPTTNRPLKFAPSQPATDYKTSRIVAAGYRLLTFTPAAYYLEHCTRKGLDPRPCELMRRLLPGGLPLRNPEYVAWNLPVQPA